MGKVAAPNALNSAPELIVMTASWNGATNKNAQEHTACIAVTITISTTSMVPDHLTH